MNKNDLIAGRIYTHEDSNGIITFLFTGSLMDITSGICTTGEFRTTIFCSGLYDGFRRPTASERAKLESYMHIIEDYEVY